MTKKILVIYYTQSGQLQHIVDKFSIPFLKENIDVEILPIFPKTDFPFPWTSNHFFDVMPESVMGVPVALAPFELRHTKYDLVVFAYQPWFLSPSIPATSILFHPTIKPLLENTPVITIIGARSLWIRAQEKIKHILKEANAKLVGNIVLTDKHDNFVSMITMMHWMFTGRKSRFLGFFPTPGITKLDVSNTILYGEIANKHLLLNDWKGLQEEFILNRAVEVKTNLMFVEAKLSKIFSVWASTIIKRKNRKIWIMTFKYYLLIVFFIIIPILLGFYNLFCRPFLSNSTKRKKAGYLGL